MPSPDFPTDPPPSGPGYQQPYPEVPPQPPYPTEPGTSYDDESTRQLWDADKKLIFAGEHGDQRALGMDTRVASMNMKWLADMNAQLGFQIAVAERNQQLIATTDERMKNTAQFWQAYRQTEHANSDERQHRATLNNIEYAAARGNQILGARVLETGQQENIGTAMAAQLAEAAVNRTETTAANTIGGAQAQALVANSIAQEIAQINAQMLVMMDAVRSLNDRVLVVNAETGNQPPAEPRQ